jgi:hypothetical protein
MRWIEVFRKDGFLEFELVYSLWLFPDIRHVGIQCFASVFFFSFHGVQEIWSLATVIFPPLLCVRAGGLPGLCLLFPSCVFIPRGYWERLLWSSDTDEPTCRYEHLRRLSVMWMMLSLFDWFLNIIEPFFIQFLTFYYRPCTRKLALFKLHVAQLLARHSVQFFVAFANTRI